MRNGYTGLMRNQRLLKNFGDFMNCLYQKGLTDHIYYLTRKSTHRDKIKDALKVILSEQKIVSIDGDIIENALNSDFKDFEDYNAPKKFDSKLMVSYSQAIQLSDEISEGKNEQTATPVFGRV